MTTTTTYPVICPPQSPPIESMGTGDTFADFTVITHGVPDPYGVDQCWDCERGFSRDTLAVIVTYTANLGDSNPSEADPAEVFGLHVECAEDYRKRAVPIVVTIHPDGTASVVGPGDVRSHGMTVTVVIEAK